MRDKQEGYTGSTSFLNKIVKGVELRRLRAVFKPRVEYRLLINMLWEVVATLEGIVQKIIGFLCQDSIYLFDTIAFFIFKNHRFYFRPITFFFFNKPILSQEFSVNDDQIPLLI